MLIKEITIDLLHLGAVTLTSEQEEERFRLMSALESLGIPYIVEYKPEVEEFEMKVASESEPSIDDLTQVPSVLRIEYEDEPKIQDLDFAPQQVLVKGEVMTSKEQRYKNWKGGTYKKIGETVPMPSGEYDVQDILTAKHHETQELMLFPKVEGGYMSPDMETYVLYVSEKDGQIWAREKDGFYDFKEVDGNQIQRFIPLF